MGDERENKVYIPNGGPIVFMDPASLDIFGSHEDNLDNEEEVCFEDLLSDPEYREMLESAMKSGLPAIEQDIFNLYYFQDHTQEEIGKILGVSQRTISYRLSRGICRLKYFIFIDSIDFTQFREDISRYFDALYVNIVIGVISTSSQTLIGDLLGLSQSQVRWRFYKVLQQLPKISKSEPEINISERWNSYYNIMNTAVKKFGIFSETWDSEIDKEEIIPNS